MTVRNGPIDGFGNTIPAPRAINDESWKSIAAARKETIDRLVAAMDEAANLVWTSPTQAEAILRRATTPLR